MNLAINRFEMSVKSIKEFKSLVGEQIGSGDYATVWEMKDSEPKHVYKVIQTNDFGDGLEAVIAKIAGKIGVGPVVHSTFYVGESLAVIEMDYAGKSLGQQMEDLAEKRKGPPEELPLTEPVEGGKIKSRYTITPILKKEKVSVEEAIEALYENAETFYFQLFSNIKKLAMHKISFGDSHVGNIIPIPESEVELIDFGSATIYESEEEARERLNTPYNFSLLRKYSQLPGLSEKSERLIEWFGINLEQTCIQM